MSRDDEVRVEELLPGTRVKAPDSFVDSVMAALPDAKGVTPRTRVFAWLPRGGRAWLVPALVGAAAVLLLITAVSFLRSSADGPASGAQTVSVVFDLHAPGAERVDLVGSFNNWEPGTVALEGPDRDGHWKATVTLPEGRHEYIFLVDGSEWVTDPKAKVLRPDGFGNRNVILEI